ncbi:MAG: 3-deoxy-7-phosphoheptulonate synthase [Betaproteobacteria bacterium TMED156]|mgnify:CR=1 FL=1|nr:MAG: 3-deoxy-7-phosphoheptulonate synthase [Betaproteobacteria bacterium TMED156]
MVKQNTDDLRIQEIREVSSPIAILEKIPISHKSSQVVFDCRESIHKILHELDDRVLVIIGPCSIHDPKAAIEYAKMLVKFRQNYANELEILMRVYFEKPRTTVGWKGLINDPHLDNSFDINTGLHVARKLLSEINDLGLPAAVEFLDVISPQYIADLVSWGAIGARTTESQVHRELASGLSCPVGFKNGTSGDVKVALDAVKASQNPHHFLSVTKSGQSAIVATSGNKDCHIILRGGKEPNFDSLSVKSVCEKLNVENLPSKVIVDASHGNSRKKPENQLKVIYELASRISQGEKSVFGVMIESHLVGGRQDLLPGNKLKDLTYGQSITDGCISWKESEKLILTLAEAVKSKKSRSK